MVIEQPLLGNHVEDVTSVGGCRVQGREVAADLAVAFLGREPVTADEDRSEKSRQITSVYMYSYSREFYSLVYQPSSIMSATRLHSVYVNCSSFIYLSINLNVYN